MNAAEYMAVPPAWRALVSEINGGRIPDGEPGVRDVDAPCDAFEPVGGPFVSAHGNGDCDTDGHYICAECVHISERALRRRQDLCEDCGAALRFGSSIATDGECSAGCDERLPPLPVLEAR